MAQSRLSNSLFETSHLEKMDPARVALVFTEWNEQIVAEQIRGCEKILGSFQAQITDMVVVPGSFEIPFACKALWNHYASKPAVERPEALITFGAVIRGGTPHFDFVCKAVTEGITQLNITLPVPVIFGVLTLDNEQQAWERLGGEQGHKGEEAGLAALKMIYFSRKYPSANTSS
jgi:6,7-dimethyl-8-ribityllumazine synthase